MHSAPICDSVNFETHTKSTNEQLIRDIIILGTGHMNGEHMGVRHKGGGDKGVGTILV